MKAQYDNATYHFKRSEKSQLFCHFEPLGEKSQAFICHTKHCEVSSNSKRDISLSAKAQYDNATYHFKHCEVSSNFKRDISLSVKAQYDNARDISLCAKAQYDNATCHFKHCEKSQI
ncbi:hypothetical protein [Campylobacter troglodytis]|uniref:hypothetical protein n=1 Tax=Campylobacter troglodytis TaxID=654363 RepID=UPI001159C282|nr:hypothetical protein [Campylobacter troglodytis]TQR61349.1 hypothetical protein DMC01_01900 [Campylobacter troglodytis]